MKKDWGDIRTVVSDINRATTVGEGAEWISRGWGQRRKCKMFRRRCYFCIGYIWGSDGSSCHSWLCHICVKFSNSNLPHSPDLALSSSMALTVPLLIFRFCPRISFISFYSPTTLSSNVLCSTILSWLMAFYFSFSFYFYFSDLSVILLGCF